MALTRYPGSTDEAYPDIFNVIPPQPAEKKPGQLSRQQLETLFGENSAKMSETKKSYSGHSDESHPEVFTTPPAQSGEYKHGQLNHEQLLQYFKNGFLIIEDFFDKKDLDACKTAIEKQVDDLAEKLYKGGKIKSLYKEYDISKRLTMLEKEFPGANILLHKQGKLPQAFRNVWSNEKLLNIVEQLIGPDIAGHPVWNLRTKTPQNEATTVPWHQDVAYLDSDSYKVLQPTAWIPLLDATEKNGCMQMICGGHKTGRVADHTCCYGQTWYVMLNKEDMESKLDVNQERDLVTCPIPYGGFLLFNNLIPHRSLNNLSDEIRWSLDLRWQNPSKPYGFHGLKEGVVMRDSKKPNLAIDWESFDGVDRTVAARDVASGEEDNEFDTIITGPWMTRWEMVHENRHTAHLKARGHATAWHTAAP